MESLAYKEELRAHRRGHPGLPLQCLWSSIMTTTAPLLGPWTQTTRCLLCQSFVTTACRLWCVTREDGTASRRALTGPLGSAGRQCPKVERGQRVQHRRHLFHPHHRPLAITLTFPLLSFSFLSLCSFLSSFSTFAIFMCGPIQWQMRSSWPRIKLFWQAYSLTTVAPGAKVKQ